MFSRRLLSMGPQAPLHPAPWEGWVTNQHILRSWSGACMFSCKGEPCDCACGCGWGNLGCGWTCEARGCPPEYSDDGCGAFPPIKKRMFPPPPWFAVGWHVTSYDRHSMRILEDRMDALPRHGWEMGGHSWAYPREEFEEYYPIDQEWEEYLDSVSSFSRLGLIRFMKLGTSDCRQDAATPRSPPAF